MNGSALGDINASEYRTILDDVVDRLNAHAAGQTTTKRAASAAAAKKIDRRRAVRDHYVMGNLASSRIAAALVILLGLSLMTVLASTYVGHSSSPYGVCYGPSGRPIPCAVVAQSRKAHGP